MHINKYPVSKLHTWFSSKHYESMFLKLLSAMSDDILTLPEKIGYRLEWAIHMACNYLKVEHQSNPFNPIEWKKKQRKGTDCIVKHRKRMMLLEAKNLAMHYSIQPSTFIEEFLDRFLKSDPAHKSDWILIVSKANFSRQVLDLIRKNRIKVIQVRFQVTINNLKSAVQKLIMKLALVFGIRGGVFGFIMNYMVVLGEKIEKCGFLLKEFTCKTSHLVKKREKFNYFIDILQRYLPTAKSNFEAILGNVFVYNSDILYNFCRFHHFQPLSSHFHCFHHFQMVI